MNKEEFLKLFKGSVEIDPQRHGGVPVLKGTRFPVSQLINQIAPKAIEDFMSEFDYEETTGKDLELFFECLSNLFWYEPIGLVKK